MAISLYDATIPSMLQLLGAGHNWLDKASAGGMKDEDLSAARLAEDMLPFNYQIKSMAVHSQEAIKGLRAGVFSPDFSDPPATFEGLHARLSQAEEFLEGLSEEEMNAFVGADMRFEIGEKVIPFTGEGFLFSFTQPNFYFHASTAYGILRARGVKLGKLDFMGAIRAKQG